MCPCCSLRSLFEHISLLLSSHETYLGTCIVGLFQGSLLFPCIHIVQGIAQNGRHRNQNARKVEWVIVIFGGIVKHTCKCAKGIFVISEKDRNLFLKSYQQLVHRQRRQLLGTSWECQRHWWAFPGPSDRRQSVNVKQRSKLNRKKITIQLEFPIWQFWKNIWTKIKEEGTENFHAKVWRRN